MVVRKLLDAVCHRLKRMDQEHPKSDCDESSIRQLSTDPGESSILFELDGDQLKRWKYPLI